jgi:RNA polymerase sigma-70 factor (ECF subfamily)
MGSPSDPHREDLEALLVRTLPAIESYLRLRMGPVLRARESAADLAQSVATGALLALGEFSYRGEGAFRRWLFERARHKLQEHVRHFRAAGRDPRREQAGSGVVDDVLPAYRLLGTPSQELASTEAIAAIERAFDTLPEDWQEAVTLHRIAGLSHAEIADRLGRSEGAVRNLVYRGLSRLAIQLEKESG